MNKSTSTASQRVYSTLLILGVLVGVCLSFSFCFCLPDVVRDTQRDVESSYLQADATSLRPHVLTTSRDARTDTAAREQNRIKQRLAHMAIIPPEKPSALAPVVRQFAPDGNRSLQYSYFFIYRPLGRAPPRIA
ncbi:MAG TPA: hypothetical protein VKB86_21650 [Pyrinomonadaceae bacterium]|nr:hypothetical protein [Pyrinomonadaceae bacterium]